MTEASPPYIYKYAVQGVQNGQRAQELRRLIEATARIDHVDINLQKQLIRIIAREPLAVEEFAKNLNKHGFQISDFAGAPVHAPSEVASQSESTVCVAIDGMTCRSCELIIERNWKKLPHIKKVEANAAKGQAVIIAQGEAPALQDLQKALEGHHYRVRNAAPQPSPVHDTQKYSRPSVMRLIGLFALVIILGKLLSSLGLFQASLDISNTLSFGAVFILGLVAASSSCVAVTGGLLLSVTGRYAQHYASRGLSRMRPVFLFVGGRIVSYTFLGGLLGSVGEILAPSPRVTAFLMILAALYMLVMGLDMLNLAPSWLKRILPRMSKKLSHRIMDAQDNKHPFAPALLGAATFFLPCGFTQALQLYALTTGSFAVSASILLAFALGTAPALIALGFASSSLRKGAWGRLFFQFSGALVIVLGLWNIQNGLTIAGYPLSLPALRNTAVTQVANAGTLQELAPVQNGVQTVRMNASYGGYEPNRFVIRAGVPVRWEVNAQSAGGCTSVLVMPQYNIQKVLARGLNVIEFTPQAPGNVAFSCSMGMYRGNFTVVPTAT